MKKALAVILAIILIMCAAALAQSDDAELTDQQEDAQEIDDDFGFDFADDGYDGEWMEIEDLGIEFCLPEDWSETDHDDATCFTAEKKDGGVRLSIRLEAEDITDIMSWGETNLNSYELEEANFYDTLVVEEEGSLAIRFVTGEGKLIAFDFTRTGLDALTREDALKIVSSACELWDDDVVFDDEDDDFDFGEAFEDDPEEDLE